eukprot:360019-Chlamydomonas_euryale.AAC.19
MLKQHRCAPSPPALQPGQSDHVQQLSKQSALHRVSQLGARPVGHQSPRGGREATSRRRRLPTAALWKPRDPWDRRSTHLCSALLAVLSVPVWLVDRLARLQLQNIQRLAEKLVVLLVIGHGRPVDHRLHRRLHCRAGHRTAAVSVTHTNSCQNEPIRMRSMIPRETATAAGGRGGG